MDGILAAFLGGVAAPVGVALVFVACWNHFRGLL
jgi:hypothetical protein